eukprot:gnl/MRDRNA2_/MRDRNA2_126597_c0_seq1.p1 gnl/MRDRNA2_/MRDRNA2_126597_c0~~gnl/MRDRNA2_/MRDRNA2_126597_c0_seq1.p1  ORF type:complete len:711 (+),score=109.14 gnl/MRDRNA2_/MRDRNA2_126597_c0_seq1:80-2134(+)
MPPKRMYWMQNLRVVFRLRTVCRWWCEWMFQNYLSKAASSEVALGGDFHYRAQEALRRIASCSKRTPSPWDPLVAAKRQLDWPSYTGHASVIGALSKLAAIGDQDTLGLVAHYVVHGNSSERHQALSGITRIASSNHSLLRQVLLAKFKDRSQDVRELALRLWRSTFESKDANAVDAVITVLWACRGPEAKTEALKTLAHVAPLGDPKAMDAAVAFTKVEATQRDKEYWVRADALRALVSIAPKNNPTVIERVMACMSDTWGTVVEAAWKVLPDVVDEDGSPLTRPICELLNSKCVAQQMLGLQLADAFPRAADNVIQARLITLASSQDADIRYEMLRMACPRASRKRRIGLISVERYSKQGPKHQPSSQGLALAVQRLKDKSRLIRFAAVGAIMRIAERESANLSNDDAHAVQHGLVDRLQDHEPDIRSRALEALHKLGYVFDSHVLPAVVSRTEDRCLEVAHWAARALQFGARKSCICSACDGGGEASGCDTDAYEECSNHNLRRPVNDARISLIPKFNPSWVWYVSKEGLDKVRKLLAEGNCIPADVIERQFVNPNNIYISDDHLLVAVDMRACGLSVHKWSDIIENLGPTEAARAYCRAADLYNVCSERLSHGLISQMTVKELRQMLEEPVDPDSAEEALMEESEEECSEEQMSDSDLEHDMLSRSFGVSDMLQVAFSGL